MATPVITGDVTKARFLHLPQGEGWLPEDETVTDENKFLQVHSIFILHFERSDQYQYILATTKGEACLVEAKAVRIVCVLRCRGLAGLRKTCREGGNSKAPRALGENIYVPSSKVT